MISVTEAKSKIPVQVTTITCEVTPDNPDIEWCANQQLDYRIHQAFPACYGGMPSGRCIYEHIVGNNESEEQKSQPQGCNKRWTFTIYDFPQENPEVF